MKTPVIWTLSANDPSGHTGILCDSAVIRSFGATPEAIVSTLTAQNRSVHRGSYPVDPELIVEQAEALFAELRPAAIKVGLLHNVHTVLAAGKILDRVREPVILDPVMSSSHGTPLADFASVEALRSVLLRKAKLVTPNAHEAELLTGVKVKHRMQYPEAAQILHRWGAKAVLIKDSLASDDSCQDFYSDGKHQFWLCSERFPQKPPGTGSCLASAIASAFVALKDMTEAVIVGTAYTKRAIRLANDRLHLAPWPAEEEDMPRLLYTSEPAAAFPDMGSEPIGFYPIVPNAAWIKKVRDWGAKTVQLRIKELPRAQIEQEIADAVEICKGSSCRLFINDYWELALKYGAYGVHLGEDDLGLVEWEPIEEAGLRLGLSTYSYYDLARALAHNPSYISVGPIHPSLSQLISQAPLGNYRIDTWSRLCPFPLVAVGGMTVENAKEAIAAGADGLACIDDLIHHPDPESRAKEWIQLFD